MISLVIPIFNEEESIKEFHMELVDVMKTLNKSYDINYIDDGSTDSSLSLLKSLAEKDESIRIFSFRKNQGKAEALTYGFHNVKGDVIVTLDADLQDRPQEIKKLLEKMREGWDVVCGWRKDRKDPKRKIISSKLFNILTHRFWGLELHDYNCGLKMYTKEAAQSLYLYGGMHRFIPVLVYQQGFSVTEVPVMHELRKYGKSKYGFSKLWKDFPDVFTMFFLTKYSMRPMHFFGTVGLGLSLTGIIILIYLSYLHFVGEAIGRRPLLFLGMLLVLSGFQVFFTGFIADLILNVAHKKEQNLSLKYTTDTK